MSDLAALAIQLKNATETTQLLELILQGAVSCNASDIHIEPEEADFRIRFRIDGVLQEIVKLPKESYKNLISRLKLFSKMDLNVKDKPQDGRFSREVLGRHFDFRTATLPLIYGENLVLRLLEQEARFYTLSELGFHKEIEEKIRQVIKRPTGMILNSGPTGCGKTTTLYAILNELNKPNVKIITLEDPIEYKMEGLAQTQINPEEGLDFVEGLRGALRSDPDIIMIGEIRDVETAEIALQAALTGHLVLSTFHANSAPATLIRLVEIGIKPHLLSGSINLVISQRLVRKICPDCRVSVPIDKRIADYLKIKLPGYKIPSVLYRGRGCQSCSGTGYKGRTAIGEILVPTPELEELIIQKASLPAVTQKVRQSNPLTMEQDGLLKVLEGITSLEEVFRVTRE